MNLHLYKLVLLVLTPYLLSAQQSHLADNINSPQCRAWVDSVFNTLTPRDRITQLMIANVSPAQGVKSKENIKAFVNNYHVGGMLFSEGNADNFAEMTNYAQSLSKVPLLMTLDGEWGAAMRVKDAPKFPYNMGLGAIQDAGLLYKYGQEVARECQAMGVHVNFAPVLDVNSNPANPVIGRRSFGEDAQKVALLGRAYSLGLEDGGVMAVGKHFPGHGDTNSDSHKTLPTVDHNMQTLREIDLLPFQSFINANLGGIMVGHLSVPAIDKAGIPTSMSKKATTQLLKEDMGFKGLVFTDGLGMKGAVSNENQCVAALKAGADVLLGPINMAKSIEAVEAAVKSGKIPQSVIDERCRKVLAYKYVLGLNKPHTVDPTNIKQQLNTPEAEALIQQLADASITAIHNNGKLLPIGNLDKSDIAVVNIGAPADNEFTKMCRRYADVSTYAANNAPLTQKALAEIKKHNVVIAAVYRDDANAQNTLASLKGVNELITVFFVNPYKMQKFAPSLANAGALLTAYDDQPQLRKTAAKALFGGIDITGRMPVNVKGIAKVGDGVNISKIRLGYSSPAAVGLSSNLTERIDSAVNAAMNAGAFPGAQVVVVKDGEVIVDRCYGYTTKGGANVTPETVYDLASVSKTVGTLPGVMKAYDNRLFDMDTPAYKYIPGLDVDGKREITPRMLLFHETGMPASMNMFNTMMDPTTYTGKVVSTKKDRDHTTYINGGGYGHDKARMRTDITSRVRTDQFNVEAAKGIYTGQITYDTIMQRIYDIEVKPTRKYVYSCLNFCLLMDLEQRLTGQNHDKWVTEQVWAPIGAYSMCYRPTQKYGLEQIAATEQDTYLRKQHVHGFVHDELAAFSGGVQGNAGVFGNANDIAKLCQTWLNGGWYGDKQVFSEGTNQLFTTSKSKTCRRGLGFDKPDMNNKDNSPTCDEASASTYGHTGFTGTCFWVDPDQNLIFVFLCNRVDPSRSNKAFSESSIRPTLMSMVYQSIASDNH